MNRFPITTGLYISNSMKVALRRDVPSVVCACNFLIPTSRRSVCTNANNNLILNIASRRHLFTVKTMQQILQPHHSYSTWNTWQSPQLQLHKHLLSQSSCRLFSMKVRRAKRRKREREEAAKKLEDIPNILDEYVYITTMDKANMWAQTAMDDMLRGYITGEITIYAGLHAVWCTDEMSKNNEANITSTDNVQSNKQRLALLQVSVPHTPVAVFHLSEIRKKHNHQNTDGDSNSNALSTNLTEMTDTELAIYQQQIGHEFPIMVKKLLELSHVIICAIRAEEMVTKLYQYEQVDCMTHVDLVDLANKALTYNGEDMKEILSSDLWKWNQPNLLSSKIMDHLCYYFLTVTNRDKAIPFERPSDENDVIVTRPLKQQLLEPISDMIVKYYAAHAYHARLLSITMIEMIDDGEEQFVHDDYDATVFMLSPNIVYHPNIVDLPDPLTIGRKVAILMTDEEYENDILDEADNGPRPSRTPNKKLHDFRMKKSYSHKVIAIGTIYFICEPHGICRRLYGTSYFVGKYNEDEAIIKLQQVKRWNFPVLELCCHYEKYWTYPFHSHDTVENDKCYKWPNEPTMGWVYQNALRPYVVVDQSRLVLFNKREIVNPDDKPWFDEKKDENLLPELPTDISKYL